MNQKNWIVILAILVVILVGVVIYSGVINKSGPTNNQPVVTNLLLETVPPAEVVTAAKNAPPQLLDGGILGDAYKEYTISNQNINNYTSETNFPSVLATSTIWYFSVVSSKNGEAILTVDFFKGIWQAVSIGKNGLALELKKAEEKWPRSSGYNKALLTIYQCDSSFLIVNKNNKYSLYPLTRFSEYSLNSDLYDPSAIMKIVKEKGNCTGK